ncbi:MAG: alginate export family protein [Planctomycetes bacterium]|nr:alginate export family protein [Planctomycetota bacterium]
MRISKFLVVSFLAAILMAAASVSARAEETENATEDASAESSAEETSQATEETDSSAEETVVEETSTPPDDSAEDERAEPPFFESEFGNLGAFEKYTPLPYIDYALEKAGPIVDSAFLWACETIADQRDLEFQFHFSDRIRAERSTNWDVGQSFSRDGAFIYNRELYDFRFKVKQVVVARAHIVNAEAINDLKEQGPLERDPVDLFEGFADLNQWDNYYLPFVLRGGRFRLNLGSGRILGMDMWDQVPLTYDGVMGLTKIREIDMEAAMFYAFPVLANYRNANASFNDEDLFGLYVSFKQFGEHKTRPTFTDLLLSELRVDTFFLMQRNKDDKLFSEKSFDRSSTSGSSDRYTVGFESNLQLGEMLSADAFFAYQFGRSAGNTISASARHVGIEWNTEHSEGLRASWIGGFYPEVRVDYDFATGDSDPEDGYVETYDQVHPSNHGRFGVTDVTGFRNIVHLGLTAGIDYEKKYQVNFGYHFLRQDTDADALYNRDGEPYRISIVEGGDKFIGTSTDLALGYTYSDRISIEISYGRFDSAFAATSGSRQQPVFHFFAVSMEMAF